MAHALRSPNCTRFLFLLLLTLVAAMPAVAQPTFTKVFTPDSIGPGSVSTLTFTIDNTLGGAPVADLAFTDVLPTVPGDVDIADPANASTDCADGIVTAPDGGGTISLSDGKVGIGEFCTVTVDVTASTPGLHTNTTGDLTSTAGNSGTATDDLIVVTTLPGFSKSFAPSSVSLGGRSTLTFTIDNSLNALRVGNLEFTDNLPSGMLVADPANASTDCVSASAPDTTLTAIPGTSVIALDAAGSTFFPGFEVLPVGATCTVTVDVTGTGTGVFDNVTSDLLADFTSSGKASATLDVTITPLAIQKSFTDDPVPPGSTVTLEFVIDNFDRNFSATDVAFTDDLTTLVPALAGLTFSSLLSNDCGGSVAGVGGTTIGFSGGTLAAQGSCTIRVSLSVPAGATPGAYVNTTSTVTGTVDGSPVVGNMATETLFVEPVPLLTKEFLEVGTLAPDPVINAGDDVVLRFTITNTSTTSMATDIAFIDELTDGGPLTGFLPFPVTLSPALPVGVCGGSLGFVFPDIERQGLSLTGGTLDPAPGAGSTCTFDLTITTPANLAPNTYLNTTGSITATVDGATRTGSPASDTLTVIAAPSLIKEFTDDPAAPGDMVTLEFTLSHSLGAPGDATNISFTDDLNAALTGLQAVGLPLSNICGAGSMISGTTSLTFTGGTLAPGASCNFSVTLQIPLGAASGSHTNTTSAVSATVGGQMATASPASDDLTVIGLTFTKEFLTNPVLPGGTTTLRFTIANTSPDPMDDATITFFTDNLALELPGLAATGPPTVDTCGGALSGTTFLVYVGGAVMVGATCTIEVDVLVPPAAADGTYANLTSSLAATVDGSAVIVDPAFNELTVDSNLLALSKSFTDDPVEPGDTVTLEFTITNLDPVNAASAIAFTDDLDAALSGLMATGLPMAACGGTADGIPDAGTIDFSGGTLTGGEVCTFSVTLQVPAAVPLGTTVTNTTSDISGTITGLPVVGAPASDDLVINFLSLTKAFDGPSVPGGTPTLTFTIENLSGSTAVTGIDFTDDLDAVLSGLMATGLPMNDVCGGGSVISGTSFLTISNGSLDPGTMCVINVPLQVPGAATAGTYPNTTSDLTLGGIPAAGPATADLVIEPPPTFAKSFTPTTIGVGGASALRFDIDNTASAVAATALAFVDNLPAGVEIDNPPNASNGCGGTLTAVVGTTTITFTGGTVAAGASCTIEVTVTATTSGVFVNTTGDLTSSSGSSGTASDTLTVTDDISITKTFLSNPVLPGGSVDLEFTITNGSALTVTDIAFTDDLDTVVPGLVATGVPVMDVCGAGSMLSGASVLTLSSGTLGPGTFCTFAVTLTVPAGAAAGIYTNDTSDVTGMAGGSGVFGAAASDDLEVVFLLFQKIFDDPDVVAGETTTLTFTITNPDPVNTATGIGFTDDLDAVLPGLIAVDTPLMDICGAGSSFTGTSLLTFAGGTVAPGASCMFTVTVEIPEDASGGNFINLTSELGAVVGGSPVTSGPAGIAVANLTVTAVAEIPTLAFWGLFLLAGALALLGLWMLRGGPLSRRI